MKGKRPFLQWSLFTCLVLIGLIIGAKLGLVGLVFEHDPTRMITVNALVFLVTTVWLGRLSWRLDGGENLRIVEDELENGHFAAEACVTLGLLGTVIGYIAMVQNSGSGSQLADQIRGSLGPALISTAVGGFCGILLQVQSHFIGQGLKRAARSAAVLNKEGGS